MKQRRLPDSVQIQIFHIKHIIGAGIVKNNTIHAGNGQNDGIGGSCLLRHNHTVLTAICTKYPADNIAEIIPANLSHQCGIRPQYLHSQPCIGNCPACTDCNISCRNQFARCHHFMQAGHPLSRYGRRDVHTDMTCNHYLLSHITHPFFFSLLGNMLLRGQRHRIFSNLFASLLYSAYRNRIPKREVFF